MSRFVGCYLYFTLDHSLSFTLYLQFSFIVLFRVCFVCTLCLHCSQINLHLHSHDRQITPFLCSCTQVHSIRALCWCIKANIQSSLSFHSSVVINSLLAFLQTWRQHLTKAKADGTKAASSYKLLHLGCRQLGRGIVQWQQTGVGYEHTWPMPGLISIRWNHQLTGYGRSRSRFSISVWLLD